MSIELYDKVKLKNGNEAFIVEIYEQDVAYEADITVGDEEYITDTIRQEEIAEVLKDE